MSQNSELGPSLYFIKCQTLCGPDYFPGGGILNYRQGRQGQAAECLYNRPTYLF